MEKEFLTDNKIDKDKLREQALSSLRASHKRIINRINDAGLKWAVDNDLRKQAKVKAKSAITFGRDTYGSKDKFEHHIKVKAFEYSKVRQAPPEQNYLDALGNSADQAVGVTRVYEEIASRMEKLTPLSEEEQKTMAYFAVRQDMEEELRKLASLDTEKEIYIKAEETWKARAAEKEAKTEEEQKVKPEDTEAAKAREDKSREVMEQAAQDYIQAKSVSRSVWKSIGSWLRRKHPGKNLKEKREKYERLRNEYIEARIQNGNINLKEKDKLAEKAAALVEEETKWFAKEEWDKNEKSRAHRIWGRFYSKPGVRAATGLALNIGIGVSAATGLWPVTAGLVAARITTGTVGFEGLFHKGQDLFSRHRGARSLGLIEAASSSDAIRKSLASWYEDRIRKRYSEEPEAPLWQVYREKLAKEIRDNLGLEDQVVGSRPLLNALKADTLNLYKDNAATFERNASAARWAAGLFAAVGLTLVTGGFEKIPLESVPYGEVPDQPDIWIPEPIAPDDTSLLPTEPGSAELFTDYTYKDPDFFYRDLATIDSFKIGNGDISSVEGRIQYLLGRDYYGIFKSPDDVYARTPEAYERLKEFWQRFGSDNLAQERVRAGIEHYRAINNLDAFDVTFRDTEGSILTTNRNLLWHRDGNEQLIKYWERSNWKDFFNNLGRGYPRN